MESHLPEDLKSFLKHKKDKVFNNPRADRSMPILGNLSQKEIDDYMLYDGDGDRKREVQIINGLSKKIARKALENIANRRQKKKD
tara:strand:- start:1917 stop:2171 length:255 start_codon:yes stop_codon:yes gene_type:complete